MKAMSGMKQSYKLQTLIQSNSELLRGMKEDDQPLALNHHLYTVIRTNRAYRRALLTSLLNLFDDTSVSVSAVKKVIVYDDGVLIWQRLVLASFLS